MGSVEQLVRDLTIPEKREDALAELSKKRETSPDLAPLLWHSYGSLAALLQEIVSIYPQLNPPVLSNATSNRVCNALALLQCLASHQDTRQLFLTVSGLFQLPLRPCSPPSALLPTPCPGLLAGVRAAVPVPFPEHDE